ncbi:MAG: hypothetical protein QN120_12940 [Armatimonadota bacterium]|nr:hypothetical protein [Armatimonadota bacterium]
MLEWPEADRRPLLLAAGLGAVLALVVLVQPFPQAAVAAAATAVGVLGLANRRLLLYLVPPAVALSPEIPVLGIPVRVEDLLMVPLVAGWAAHLLIYQDRRGTPLDRLLVGYATVGVVATVWGGLLGTAHFFTTNPLFSGPFHVLKRIEFVLLFLILADTLGTVAQARRFAYLVLASLAGLEVFALATFLSTRYLALAPAGSPVHEPGLAGMLIVALGLGLFPAASRGLKAGLAVLMLFSLGILPLTLGRNFTATTALVIAYVGLTQQRWALALLPVPWLVVRYLYPEHVLERLLSLQYLLTPDVTGGATQGAALLSRVIPPGYHGLLALGYSPLLGFGLASRPLGAIDSEYATQLFYTGLVGLALFLTLGRQLFRMAAQARVWAGDPSAQSLARGLQLALAAYAVFSIFSPSISAARAGGVFFLLAGVLAVLHRAGVDEAAGASSRGARALRG